MYDRENHQLVVSRDVYFFESSGTLEKQPDNNTSDEVVQKSNSEIHVKSEFDGNESDFESAEEDNHSAPLKRFK